MSTGFSSHPESLPSRLRRPDLPKRNSDGASNYTVSLASSSTSLQSSEAPGEKNTPKKRTPIRRKSSLLNVAPLDTTLDRRLQTLSVAWHTVSIPFFFCLFLFVLYLGSIAWVAIIIPYFIWFYGFDLHTPTNGKSVYRIKDWMRNLILWEWFVDYFPIRVHKTCHLQPTYTWQKYEDCSASDDEEDLVSEVSRARIDSLFRFFGLRKRLNDVDPAHLSDGENDRKRTRYRKVSSGPRYIFGYHPHGVISMGVMGLFGTNILRNEPFEPPFRFLSALFHKTDKNKRLFPGLGFIFPLTLSEQFSLPFFRDYLLSLGLTSASAKNIKSLISNGDNSVCIVVGGAQESLLNDVVGSDHRVGIGYDKGTPDVNADVAHADKKQIRLVLNKRKGFVKLAIELGNVLLVPVFAFGEADIYNLTTPSPGSWGHSFQQWMKRNFHFTLPFFSARGVFIYDFGFLPFRTPINIVTGKPIHVPANLLVDAVEVPVKREKRLSSLTNLLSLTKKPQATTSRKQIPQDLLDHYHGLYMEELKRLYEHNKHKFGYGEVELRIIE